MSLGTGIRKAAGLVLCVLFLGCVAALPAIARSDVATSTSTSKTKKAHASAATTKTRTATSKRRKKSSRVRGQQKIDSQRVQSIQEALIREHYLRGEATGKWDQASEEAMRRYQADNGWQNKTVPDSRALIKLGLGPSKDHLLNPESAMTTVPDPPKADPVPTTSHSSPAVSNAPQASVPSSTPVSSDTSRPQ